MWVKLPNSCELKWNGHCSPLEKLPLFVKKKKKELCSAAYLLLPYKKKKKLHETGG